MCLKLIAFGADFVGCLLHFMDRRRLYNLALGALAERAKE